MDSKLSHKSKKCNLNFLLSYFLLITRQIAYDIFFAIQLKSEKEKLQEWFEVV